MSHEADDPCFAGTGAHHSVCDATVGFFTSISKETQGYVHIDPYHDKYPDNTSKDKGWTQSHGFFVIMGGFMLYEGDKLIQTLGPGNLDQLVQDGEIEFPKITEDEIKDRSKGDWLSKFVAIGQTS